MIVGMRIGSTGPGQKSGANMRMGAEKVEQVPTPTPEDKVKEEKPLDEIKATAQAPTKVAPNKEVAKPVKDSPWGPLNSLSVAKLQKAGYSSIEGLKDFTKEELLQLNGVGDKVAEQILSFNHPK
ncbi:MAG: hypothetical protein GY775_19125 [Candidatus Scalindua sp.]|nr:hypothetical protein [Candidatus Scalindua sp.]